MSTQPHVSRKLTAVLAVIFLLPPLVLYFMWVSIGLKYNGIGDNEWMDTYLSYFPKWLSNINFIHAISIIFCVIAILLAARSFKKHLLWVRLLMLLTVVVSIFIILFDIYQLI